MDPTKEFYRRTNTVKAVYGIWLQYETVNQWDVCYERYDDMGDILIEGQWYTDMWYEIRRISSVFT